MSAQAGWYPDPGGGEDLYRYWDGKAWSAATSPNPSAAPPTGLVGATPPAGSGQPLGSQPYGSGVFGSTGYGAGSTSPGSYGAGGHGAAGPGRGPGAIGAGNGSGGTGHAGGSAGAGDAYARYQQTQQRRSPVGWWLAGAALLVVLVVVAVLAVRAASGGGGELPTLPGGQGSQNACPTPELSTAEPRTAPNDGRVHGGPVSYPQLGTPWSAPQNDERVPFGSDIQVQQVGVETNYNGLRSNWVASVLVAELQAGDGFFSPQAGSQIVVKCILGAFYGNNPVTSDVKVNEQTTIDGHDAWLVESQLSFDIPGLRTKGELLIVAIVSAGETSGLYYASIPDTTPELVQPARDALQQLRVDG